ncbi:MAG: hypothetical protein WAV02_09585 [Stellaceae bacterium]
MRIRHLGYVVLFLLVIGIATQIPIPGMKMVPLKTLPGVPASQNESIGPAPPGTVVSGQRTFQQVMADRKEIELAEKYNALPEGDPKRHAMYQEVLDAAQQGEAFPCSAKNRHRLAEAVATMGNFNRDHVGEPMTANMMVNGHPIAVDNLAGKASDIMWGALSAGVIGRTHDGHMTVPEPDAPVTVTPPGVGEGAKLFCDDPN